jgi:hypothetical protein
MTAANGWSVLARGLELIRHGYHDRIAEWIAAAISVGVRRTRQLYLSFN